MTFKTILVPLEESEAFSSVLDTSLIVARQFGSYIEGLNVRRALSGLILAGAEGGFATSPDLEERFAREAEEQARRVRGQFEAFMREHGISGGPGGDGPWASVVDEVWEGADLVGSRSRVFDLTVIGRPQRGAPTSALTTLETILFEGGRPILIASPSPPSVVGENILIAWNGSPETARTIAFAMPLLARARSVAVLGVVGGLVLGPDVAAACQHLERNGINAEAAEVEAGEHSVGEAILAECESRNADLLIKGAYTRSRLRQMIFGGATSHILMNAELPVFMAH